MKNYNTEEDERTMNDQAADEANKRNLIDQSLAGLPVVDDAVMAELLEIGGREFVAKMVAQFVSDATACVEQVVRAVESQDPKNLAEAGHGLKGICANLGVKRLQELAFQAEQLGRQCVMDGSEDLSLLVTSELTAVCEHFTNAPFNQ